MADSDAPLLLFIPAPPPSPGTARTWGRRRDGMRLVWVASSDPGADAPGYIMLPPFGAERLVEQTPRRPCPGSHSFRFSPPERSPPMPKLYCKPSEGLRKAEATDTVSEHDGTPQHFPLDRGLIRNTNGKYAIPVGIIHYAGDAEDH